MGPWVHRGKPPSNDTRIRLGRDRPGYRCHDVGVQGELSGRERELAAVDAFLERSKRRPSVLTLTGPPGIGKTVVWREALRRAGLHDYTVLSARPGEAERRLSFAGLTDLLRPMDPAAFDSLVPVQHHAIDVALMRAQADPHVFQQGAIPAAVLSLLEGAAGTRPVIIGVDDAQWLDQETAGSLSYVMRRLDGLPVGVVLTVRREGERPATFEFAVAGDEREELELGPLSVASLHEVLKRQLGQVLPRPVLVRIANSSGGNPFYALEIGRELARVGVPPLGEPLPVPAELQTLVRSRMRRLPNRTREALLVAACLSQPTTLSVDADALAPAEDAGITRIEAEGRVRFSHPLLAAAVRDSASPSRRRAVHRLLAELDLDPEERARHAAFAAAGPDESVACALDVAAEHAASRGATSAAIELSRRAIEQTPSRSDSARVRRVLSFAKHSLFGGGDVSEAKAALEEGLSTADDELRAELRLWLAMVARGEGRPQAGYPQLLTALLEAEDPRLIARIHLQAMWMSEWDPIRGLRHCDAMLELLDPAADPGLYSGGVLMQAYFRLLSGQGADDEAVQRGQAIEDAQVDPRERSPVPIIWPLLKDDLASAVSVHTKHLRWAHDIGDQALEMSMAWYLGYLEMWRGRARQAEEWASHLGRLVEQCDPSFSWGDNLLPTLRGMLEARAGRLEAAREAAEAALAHCRRIGRAEEIPAREVLGFVALSLDDAAGVVDALAGPDEVLQELGQREPAQTRFHPDLIEALIKLGELRRAEEVLGRFEERGRIFPRPWVLATGARCRALLLAAGGDLDGAIAAAVEAIRFHEQLDMPFERARTLLVQGQLLRRRKERREARTTLHEARSAFEALGAPIWAERAAAELQRIPVRRSTAELSVTEATVARLAATGLTNRQIADRAFLSPKTVEGNLARVYMKLGIRSRAELGRAIAERESRTGSSAAEA